LRDLDKAHGTVWFVQKSAVPARTPKLLYLVHLRYVHKLMRAARIVANMGQKPKDTLPATFAQKYPNSFSQKTEGFEQSHPRTPG